MMTSATLIISLLLLTSCQALREVVSADTIRPFTTDGCSMSPNGPRTKPNAFLECCVNHDLAYWQGGTLEQKNEADLALKACITEHSNPKISEIYYGAVSIGGGPQFKTPFRWGYGWPNRRTYDALNHTEKKSVEQETKKIDWNIIYQSLREQ